MKTDPLFLFFQHYLGRQRRRWGVDPVEALARLNEVMQWPPEAPAKKTAGREARPEEGIQEKKLAGPRLRAG
ncbi:hypothetical protein CXB49_04970 [Chromobacterium sp. ATCC 53434]|uniref:hypothetical protein n=1 Tax=Chromobacterium TaxID=535 RepID=UPI000C76EEFE|nr:hypothetical protein [Chromobacterium sp. ATCC 53434]AUH50217.1 hypothetical protein CXB49_04970 [Chromobacterium sp. ATCC 53434]